jgi:hypothetical protein
LKKKFDQVYQFKIILSDIKPPIWRRIQIPETYSFWDLHVAITDAMGWADYHLHEFRTKDPSTTQEVRIGNPIDEDWGITTLPEHKQKISKYFSLDNKKAVYLYDFGDGWHHIIQLEKIIPREKNTNYPKCVAGKRACPPEDCGAIPGYENILKIIKNPKHKEYKETIKWLGGKYDPEQFDINEVHFDDPDKRRRLAYE